MSASKKRSGGGSVAAIRGWIATLAALLTIASVVTGWVKVNNINSWRSGYDYFKGVSIKFQQCTSTLVKEGHLNCDTSLSGGGKGNPNLPGAPGSKNPDGTTVSSKDALMAKLDKLKVEDPQQVAYSRKEWRHWIGEPCNTRETVLKTQGKNVVSDPKTCAAKSGTWVSPYENATFTDPKQMDIDHVIPLSYAAQHGGQAWSPEKKQQFANDLTQLLATSATENRGKGDKGPGEYMPPERAFHCQYSTLWIETATKYGVSISQSDKVALKAGIQKCG